MLTSFIRTVILLFAVVGVLRLTGKRQVGQLQPTELVITILLSQVAATPMQDNDIPLLNTLVVLAALAGTEVLFSALSIRFSGVRKVLDGRAVILVRNGVPDQKQMRLLRYTIDDLTEALRAKNVFDISTVKYAVAETDGSISVLLRAESQNVTLGYYEKDPPDGGMPFLVVSDGVADPKAMADAGLTADALKRILCAEHVTQKDVFMLTVDGRGKINLIRKEQKK